MQNKEATKYKLNMELYVRTYHQVVVSSIVLREFPFSSTQGRLSGIEKKKYSFAYWVIRLLRTKRKKKKKYQTITAKYNAYVIAWIKLPLKEAEKKKHSTFFFTIFTRMGRSPLSITSLWVFSPQLFISISNNCNIESKDKIRLFIIVRVLKERKESWLINKTMLNTFKKKLKCFFHDSRGYYCTQRINGLLVL